MHQKKTQKILVYWQSKILFSVAEICIKQNIYNHIYFLFYFII